MTQRALLLVNRQARRAQKKLPQVLKQLSALGFELFEESAATPQQLPDIIRSYRDRVDLVIVGGGDGTLNAAAEGLVDTQLPLGILPLGTANDLARTLKIPQSIPRACQTIATAHIQRVDLGQVNDKYFFNVASLGLSVQITKQLNRKFKRFWGVFAYAIAAIKAIGQWRLLQAEICWEDHSIRVKTAQIAVGNGRYYGGGLAVADDAAINDQRLDLYSLEYRHWWQLLLMLPAMWRGRYGEWPFVRTLQGMEFEIYTHQPFPINADGEIVTQTPAKFRLFPEAVTVFVPPARVEE